MVFYYFNSIFPQAFSTASLADAEALSTTTVNLDFNSPFQSNFTHNAFFLITPFSSKTSLVISVIPFEAKSSKSDKLTILYSFLNFELEKPFNLGILLNKGVCPHSNQGATQPPDLEF